MRKLGFRRNLSYVNQRMVNAIAISVALILAFLMLGAVDTNATAVALPVAPETTERNVALSAMLETTANIEASPIASGTVSDSVALPTAPETTANSENPAGQLTQSIPCPERCIIFIGDSRTVCLADCLEYVEGYNKVYFYTEEPKRGVHDTIFYNTEGDLAVVFIGECRGYYLNGAFDYSVKRLKNYLNNNVLINNCRSYTYCNLFSVNDILLSSRARRTSALKYSKANTRLASSLKNRFAYYQFTAGPISERGHVYQTGLTNETIEAYNAGLVGNDEVILWDLYGFLMNQGYDCIVNEIDPEGIHYDAITNFKILNEILKLAPPKLPRVEQYSKTKQELSNS